MQLSAIGTSNLTLIDFDIVEEVNLASQGYMESDLARPKVEATAELCRRINSTISIKTEHSRFKRSSNSGNVIFCCVDSIETRKMIWESHGHCMHFFSDGRMSAEVIRVLSAHDTRSREHYPTTLFRASEAHSGACTAKSTIYTANIAAGLMISQFTKWLRNLPVENDLSLNLLTAEMDVEGE